MAREGEIYLPNIDMSFSSLYLWKMRPLPHLWSGRRYIAPMHKRLLPSLGAGSAGRLRSVCLHSLVTYTHVCVHVMSGLATTASLCQQSCCGDMEKKHRENPPEISTKTTRQGYFIFWLAQFSMWRLCTAPAVWRDLWTKPETSKRPWQVQGGPDRHGTVFLLDWRP